MFRDQPFQALGRDRCECHRPVVIQASDIGLFGDRNDCGCFKTCWES